MNTFNSVQSCVINNSIDIDYSILIPGILNKYTSIWLDASGSTNFDLTGNNVNIWKNKTTNVLNFDLTPNAGTNITYNSTSPSSVLINNGYYLKNNNFNPITSLQTWVFVLSTPTSVTPDCRIIGVNSGSGFDILIQNGTFLIYKHNTAPNTGINYPISLTANTKYLFSLSLNMSNPDFNSTKNNSIFRFNGSTKTNGYVVNDSNFNISGTSQLLIGTLSFNNNPFYAIAGNLGFNIYEMIGINNKNLGSGEVKIIENYLNKRWKLGLSI